MNTVYGLRALTDSAKALLNADIIISGYEMPRIL